MSVKVILLGDSNVGKTSFVHQYVYGVVLESQTPTIGAAMISTYVNTQKFKGHLNIWDTAGQERYRSLVPLYYRGSRVAIVIYDITNKTSFRSAISFWMSDGMNRFICCIFNANSSKI